MSDNCNSWQEWWETPENYFQHSGCWHVELSKIAVLVTWPLFACDSTSAVQLSHTSAKMAPRYEKRFSIWQPSAILDLRKLPFWSRDLYLHVILHLRFKFRTNRPIWRWDIDKKRFQYGVRPPSWIRKMSTFCQRVSSCRKYPHPLTKFDRNRIN